MREEERTDLLQTLPSGLVCVGERRPDDAARRGLGFLRRSRDGGGERRVDVVVDQALPHRAVARELHDLDVALLEIGKSQNGKCVLV